jgi:hypothetical protein
MIVYDDILIMCPSVVCISRKTTNGKQDFRRVEFRQGIEQGEEVRVESYYKTNKYAWTATMEERFTPFLPHWLIKISTQTRKKKFKKFKNKTTISKKLQNLSTTT